MPAALTPAAIRSPGSGGVAAAGTATSSGGRREATRGDEAACGHGAECTHGAPERLRRPSSGPAVDGHVRAAHDAGAVLAEEAHDAGDLLGSDPAGVVGVRHRAPVRGRVDHARQDRVGADPVVAVLGGEDVDERQQRGLGDDVAGRAGERLERRARGDADDRAAAGGLQMRDRGVADEVRRDAGSARAGPRSPRSASRARGRRRQSRRRG